MYQINLMQPHFLQISCSNVTSIEKSSMTTLTERAFHLLVTLALILFPFFHNSYHCIILLNIYLFIISFRKTGLLPAFFIALSPWVWISAWHIVNICQHECTGNLHALILFFMWEWTNCLSPDLKLLSNHLYCIITSQTNKQ